MGLVRVFSDIMVGYETIFSVPLFAFAIMGIAYLLLGIAHVLRFRETTGPSGNFRPAVTVLKPLCGEEPRLYECLRSFCTQDYPAMQLVFGVRSASDPAIAVVHRLQAEFPALAIDLVIDGGMHGANPKVSNLINMMAAGRHDVIVLSDADVEVGPHALAAVVEPLADGRVGAVTCLYKGMPSGSLASKLGALYVSDWFLPSTVVDEAMNGMDGLFGPLCALRRQALNEAGGFEALRGYLAEDNRLGKLIRQAGWEVRLSRHAVDTMVSERTLSDLLRHETRWSRTGRACRGGEHLMLPVTFPLPLLLVLLALCPSVAGIALVGLVLALRVVLHYCVRSRFRLRSPSCPWLLPLRETLCFLVWVASLGGDCVRWRDRDYHVLRDGRLEPVLSGQTVSGQWWAAKGAFLVVMVGMMDWVAPVGIEFLAFYGGAVAITARRGGAQNGLLAALLSVVSIALQGTLMGNLYSSPWFFILAVVNKAIVLFGISYFMASNRKHRAGIGASDPFTVPAE